LHFPLVLNIGNPVSENNSTTEISTVFIHISTLIRIGMWKKRGSKTVGISDMPKRQGCLTNFDKLDGE
jgi:sorbitol-specific phosphotransferase system component IIBC